MTDERVDGVGLWALLATLATLAILATFTLGNDAWEFEPPSVEPRGVFAPLVRAADEEWSLGTVRAGPMVAVLLVALASAAALGLRSWRRSVAVVLAAVVVALIIVPPLLLQVGLRDATEPWFYTNDSTYQTELAADLLLDGTNPYGYDYGTTGLERFYSLDGTVPDDVRERAPVLGHFIYFPGTLVAAAGWRLLPHPFDDYRFFVLLATLALGAAMLLVPAPFVWRLVAAAAVVANPIAVHAVWFGTADAVSIVFVLLAFALVARGRPVGAAAALAGAVLLKQFALVALPFLAIAALARGASLVRAAAAFVAVMLVGIVPFALADPGAFWSDTVEFGAGTHRIVGYGLSALFLRAGIIDDREGDYPFALLALVLWLPLTAWLVWAQRRGGALWVGAVGFATSMFVLLFIAKAFHKSYLIWPLTAIALAALLAVTARPFAPSRGASPSRPTTAHRSTSAP